jgi:hypothetical protein
MYNNPHQRTNVLFIIRVKMKNSEIAEMVGNTMHKVEQLSEMYGSLHNDNSKPVIENGFVDVASQSLSAGITVIKNKLSRYDGTVKSLIISVSSRPSDDFKNKVMAMAGELKSINSNLKTLSAINLPMHMTDQEACYVGIGYYGN